LSAATKIVRLRQNPIANHRRSLIIADPQTISIRAPVKVEGSVGTPAQNDDLSQQMARALEEIRRRQTAA
jgi:hypothetical protein